MFDELVEQQERSTKQQKKLTEQQKAYINSDDKLSLVLACPGSGKTTVLVSKITSLYKKGVNLNRILAITFTNKAASSMRKQIKEKTGITKSKDIKYFSTFHAFGKKIINRYHDKFKIKSNPEIISDEEKITIAKKIIDEYKIKNPKNSACYVEPKEFIKIISLRKNFFNSEKQTWLSDEIFNEYNESILVRDKIDTDDLIYLSYKLLLENDEIRKEIISMFDYVFVDEYQDVNNIQYKFLKVFEDSGISCSYVGDDDQSIYEFRGSEPKYIIDLANDKRFKKYMLNTNFRSDESIVEFANKFADIMNKKGKRVEKGLMLAEHKGGDIPKVKVFKNSKKDEINYICEQIDLLVNDYGVEPSQIAVLSRYGKEHNEINELKEVKNSLKSIYKIKSTEVVSDDNSSEEIQKTLAKVCKILWLLTKKIDDESLKLIYNLFGKPIVCSEKYNSMCSIINQQFGINISPTNYYEIISCYSVNKEILDYVFEDKKLNLYKEEYLSIYRFIVEEKEKIEKNCSLSKVIKHMRDFAIEQGINIDKPHNSLNSFKHFAINFEDEKKDVANQYLEALENLESCFLNDSLVLEEGKVNLLTAHKSKGLEFDIVFVMGLEPGNFPSGMNDTSIEAERRLFYVAITRARHMLYLTATTQLNEMLMENANAEFFLSNFINEYSDNDIIDISKINLNANTEIFYKQMVEKEDRIRELTKEIKENVNIYESKIEIIKKQKDALEKRLEKKEISEHEATNLKEILEEQKNKFKMLIDENNKIRKENEKLISLNSCYNNEKDELEKKIENMKKTVDEGRIKISDLRKQIFDNEKEIKSARIKSKSIKENSEENLKSLYGNNYEEIDDDILKLIKETEFIMSKLNKSVVIHEKKKMQEELFYQYGKLNGEFTDIIYAFNNGINNDELIDKIHINSGVRNHMKSILQLFAYYIFDNKSPKTIYQFSEVENEKSTLLNILHQYNIKFKDLFDEYNRFKDVIILMNVLDKYGGHRDGSKSLNSIQKNNIDKFLNSEHECKKQILLSFHILILCFLSCEKVEKFVNDVINY